MWVRLVTLKHGVTSSGVQFAPGDSLSVETLEGESMVKRGVAVLEMNYRPESLRESRVVETPMTAAFVTKPKKVQRWQ